MKKLLQQRTFALILVLISLCFFSIAQVRTKIYHDGIPKTIISDTHINGTVVELTPPEIFDKLLSEDLSEAAEIKEYANRFAISMDVDIDFFTRAKRVTDNEFVTYYLSLLAEQALNISLQFSASRYLKTLF